MSVLGPLFIPRKEVYAIPKVKDNPELEKFLQQLLQRIHTNELAIQRWANSAPRLAAIVGECSYSAYMDSNAAVFYAALPLDGATQTFFSGIVDATNKRIVIPQTGWYLVSATISWDTTLNVGDKTGNFEVEMFNGGNNPGGAVAPLTSSGTSDFLSVVATASYPSFSVQPDFQTINYAATFTAKDTIQFWGENFVFLVATLPPGVVNPSTLYRARIEACSILFLGETPSTTQ